MKAAALLFVATVLAAFPAQAVVFTVNSTGDAADTNTADGVCDSDNATPGLQCTLRAAISQANAVGGADTIAFNIPPAGAKTITPGSKLPNVNETVTLDGTTQPGFVNAPIIEINGASLGPFQALDIFAPSTIRGLVINRLTGGSGIVLWPGSNGSVVENCYIGTNMAGTGDPGNAFNGIIVYSSGNRIGGTAPNQRNVISGNGSPGIGISGAGATNNMVIGNFLGTNAAGTAALASSAEGIVIVQGANSNTIGGTAGVTPGGSCTGACNVISGATTFSGIAIVGPAVTNNVVIGNYIGTDVTGTQDVGNAGNGIFIRAPTNRVGGPTPQERNVISGNDLPGIFLDMAVTTGTRIHGNFIGTKRDGTTSLPNVKGIIIDAAVNNFIGGTAAGEGNVIAGNTLHGVEIRNGAAGNRVEGNAIGTDSAGAAVTPNTGDGVLVNNASDNVIGGTAAGAANRIARNGGNGVTVTGTSVRTSIRRNLIHDNSGLGIDLAGNGVTPNDPGDGDSGPNDLINFPEGITATRDGTANQTVIRGRLDTANPETAQVELFGNVALDPSNHGEGQIYLDTVTPDTGGFFCLTLNYLLSVDVTATATNAAGSTSEFSGKNDVELIALEVIQASQDWNNSATLIKDKTTHVRAHAQTTDPAGPPVAMTAQLRGFRSGAELPGSPLTAFNFGGFTAQPNAALRRANWNDTLNFRLPDAWLDGTVELRLERTNGPLGCKEPNDVGTPGDCANCAVAVGFTASRRLPVRFLRVKFTDGAGVVQQPDPTHVQTLTNRMFAIYPVEDLDVTHGQYSYTGTLPMNLSTLNTGLESQRMWDGCFTALGCTRLYYGVMINAGVGGKAKGIPGKVSSGDLPLNATIRGRNRHVHEIAHSLGRRHALFCGATDSTNPSFPYSAVIGGTTVATIGPMNQGDNALVYGLDTSRIPSPVVIDPNIQYELMSYCGVSYRWISRFTWGGLHTLITNTFPATASLTKGAAPEDYLVVRGHLDTANDSVRFLPFQFLPAASSPPLPPPGDYTLELRNGTGGVIAQIPFQPALDAADFPEVDSTIGSFQIPVAANPAIRQVVVLRGGVPLASRSASAGAPTVQVLFPNGGETVTQDPVVLSWSANDPDGDPLTYIVQFSSDGGGSWETLAMDWPVASYTVAQEFLEGTSTGLIRVIASDGFWTAIDQSDAVFSVANHPPIVSMLSPTPDQRFVGNQQMVFEVFARDIEDGMLSGTSLQWTSSLDGPLGSGKRLFRKATDFTAGTHTITVTGTDAGSLAASASATIIIGTSAPPSFADLSLTETGDSSVAIAGDPLTYQLTVTNQGRDTATGVTVTDTLPSGVALLSATPSQGSCGEAGGIVTCNLGSLADDDTATVTIAVTPSAAGQITNVGQVTAAEPDPVPADNMLSLTTRVDARGPADLSLFKSDSADPVSAGGGLTYTLSVGNGGPGGATSLTLTDTLPPGTSFVAASGDGWSCGHNAGTVTCSRPAATVGTVPPVMVAVTAPSVAGPITNTASVTSSVTDPVPGNNTASATTQVGGVGPAPANFHTLTPCRIADTRDSDGAFGGPALAAGLERTFTIAGRCGVPATAKAVSFNVTITGPTSLGHLSLYPGGTSLPLVSTMNFRPGDTRANNAIIRLGTGGTLAVTSGQGSGSVHFILDTNGYFE